MEVGAVQRVLQAHSLPSICQRKTSYRCLMLQRNGNTPTLWTINGLNSVYALFSPRRTVAGSDWDQLVYCPQNKSDNRETALLALRCCVCCPQYHGGFTVNVFIKALHATIMWLKVFNVSYIAILLLRAWLLCDKYFFDSISTCMD